MHELIQRLNSNRRTDILEALYELSSDQNSFDRNVTDAVVRLIHHRDADIREQAVNTAVIHWRLQETYPVLINQFKAEKDQLVLTTMCAALGSLLKSGYGTLSTVNTLLVPIILDEQLDPELRGTAYLTLLRVNDRISTKEYASASSDIENMKIDLTWLE